MKKLTILISGILFVALIAVFNYVGCGGGGGSSGSSTPPPSTAPALTTDPATNITYNSARLRGTVDPNGVNTNAYFQYGLSTSYGTNTSYQNVGSGNVAVNISYTATGLLTNTQYNFRIRAIRTDGTFNGLNQTFTTELISPTCTTNPANNVSDISAMLNGTVNPNGANVTSCYFDYGTSQSYGISVTATSLPGSGLSPVSVTANVSSLTLSTQYNFRVVATNAGGTANGLNQTFTTTALPAPICTTNAADNIADNSARLNGTVNPNGYDVTSCWFDYGTSQSYGISATVVSLPGSGTSPVSVTANVISLTAGQQYNFRVVATNANGTNNGLNQTFTIALAVDDYVWVVNQGSYTVTRIRKSDSTTTTITVGAPGPYGVAVDGTYCWVANTGGNTVTRILKSDLSTTTIAFGAIPRGIAVDRTYCWVAKYSYSTVTRILKSNPAISTTITVGSFPDGVAVDGTYVWVANSGAGGSGGNTVTRILKSDLSTTTIAVGSYPNGIAVDGTYCWVANAGSDTVTRILKSDLSTTNIAVGGGPYGASPRGVAVDESYCWVSNWNSTNVTRILKVDSTTTNITVGNAPFGVAVDGTYCWVVIASGAVTRILKADLSKTTIAVGSGPYSLGDMTGYTYDNYSNK
jgi:DNA-binding beta-propeller fold protein YncE